MVTAEMRRDVQYLNEPCTTMITAACGWVLITIRIGDNLKVSTHATVCDFPLLVSLLPLLSPRLQNGPVFMLACNAIITAKVCESTVTEDMAARQKPVRKD